MLSYTDCNTPHHRTIQLLVHELFQLGRLHLGHCGTVRSQWRARALPASQQQHAGDQRTASALQMPRCEALPRVQIVMSRLC
jgi:hypothetical protein